MSGRINSLQNQKIKFAVSLQKSSVRKKEQLFLIEGCREINLAMLAGYQLQTVFTCPQIYGKSDASFHKKKKDALSLNDKGATPNKDSDAEYSGVRNLIDILAGQAQIIETSREVFRKLAYREKSDGLLAVALQSNTALKDLKLSNTPLILVAESVEKPGNLGAMLRTADAAGVDAVLVCDGVTDIFNPNVVRSSLGTLFTTQVVCCSSKEAINWMKDMQIKIFTTALSASKPYHLIDYQGPSAIVAGAEAAGVSSIWEESSDANIIIPMFGRVDSMNVSVATSIVLYEALRQRGFTY